MSPTTPSSPPDSSFAATRWTLVLAAGNWRANPAAHRAMSDLAKLYWFPLYAYLRRHGNPPSQAEDLVQGFFARLLEKDALANLDPSKGKFRSFLLASLKNFLTNEYHRSHAQKRAPSDPVIPLDALNAEARYAAEPADHMTPERLFERRWALAVLDQVLERLRTEYTQRNQAKLFAALEPTLTAQSAPYRQIALQLNTTEPAIKVAAHRLRQRYRQLLREEIAHTVSDPDQIDEEIQQLLKSL